MENGIRLIAAGDIWLRTEGNRDPFAEVRHLLGDKDILFGNLETTLSETGEPAEKHHVISISPDAARYLVDAGFDVLSVANNHSGDRGAEGFRNTLDSLESRGILPLGGSATESRQEPVILERNGIRVGFAGYTIGKLVLSREVSINRLVEEEIIGDIASLAGRCDHIAVSLHWGAEMVYYPSPDQVDLAHRLIDAGATLILGHHPHTMQAIERYHGGLIAYSLGMLQFEHRWPHNLSREAIVLAVDLEKNGVVGECRVTPLLVDDNFIPHIATGFEGENIKNFLAEISREVAEGEITERRWFEEVAPVYMRMNIESYRYRIRHNGPLTILEMMVWFFTPFCFKCFAGLARRALRPDSAPQRRMPGSGTGN
ncbi:MULTISPECIES: CapA family protein [unclassified Methanoculleus]|uniref:CapA family protein n=1 Tax=unclassified Methanoculleus TaxID=2619537 RepID=UPI0025F1E484|nr:MULTISPECIES: CapA family protein [unclassified Methanoculleus]MCK9316758.1 CapA family protein [Methanoculleus sp.]MDD2252781.1 CapA family protein [Methanoculleus sp.]MDD2788130.1 CapA family protein [Methanoculleus sp.]MDD3215236.1 CapA family protein [Methanoculleus sp.]MDD4313024.1 CapA family protein [Methanoculleus sp.]